MKLVKDWRRAWTWFSVHCLILIAAITETWALIPADMKAAIPPKAVWVLVGVIAILGIIGRLIDQKSKAAAPPASAVPEVPP